MNGVRKEDIKNKNRTDGNICVPTANNYIDAYTEAVKTAIRSQNNHLHKKAKFDQASALLAFRKYELRMGENHIATYWAKCMELIHFEATHEDL